MVVVDVVVVPVNTVVDAAVAMLVAILIVDAPSPVVVSVAGDATIAMEVVVVVMQQPATKLFISQYWDWHPDRPATLPGFGTAPREASAQL